MAFPLTFAKKLNYPQEETLDLQTFICWNVCNKNLLLVTSSMVIYPFPTFIKIPHLSNYHSGKIYTFHVIMKAVKGLKTINNNANPPLLPKDDAHWQRLIAKVQAMTLMDDIFFNCFMEDDTAAMQYVLNIIMERHDLKVISVKTQYAVPNIHGRGVRFDVLAIDQ